MCRLNEIQIWPIDAISHIFQGNPRELTLYVCIWEVQQQCVCKEVYMMHMTRGSQQRREEGQRIEKAQPAKIGYSGFFKQIKFRKTFTIQFCIA
jgi:hypothetical protein